MQPFSDAYILPSSDDHAALGAGTVSPNRFRSPDDICTLHSARLPNPYPQNASAGDARSIKYPHRRIHSHAPGPISPCANEGSSRTLTLHFGLGSANLTPTARAELKGALPDLKSTRRITIIGRTDNTGPLAFNDSLALARALAVRDHLLKTYPTLTPALTIKAQGGCCFIAPNDTQAGRTQNRRVEVVFQMNDGLPP